jgi:hypothetical protein
MSNWKITKMQKIKEVNNEMCHNYYFLTYFRLYSEDGKRYKHGKFITWFDIFDLQEYYLEEDETRGITEDEIKQYASELSVNTLESYYKSYENTTELQDYCNETIKDYNRIR